MDPGGRRVEGVKGSSSGVEEEREREALPENASLFPL
jgi:hypothetical protein